MKQQTTAAAFRNAFNGVIYFLAKERNGRIQLVAALITIAFALLFRITATEWITVLLCIGAVLSLEMLNSAIEKLSDEVHREYHPAIKIIKDVSAGAVLVAATISVVIACIIFLPKMMDFI